MAVFELTATVAVVGNDQNNAANRCNLKGLRHDKNPVDEWYNPPKG